MLGEDDGAWAAQVFEVTAAGTFEHGASTLQLLQDPEGPGAARLADVRRRLFDARAVRVRPALDDKVVAAWNGLAITGLCDAGLRLGEPTYVDAAVAAGELLWRVHVVDGRLRRVSRDGVVGAPAGVLEDHGCVASGFLSLVQATGDAVWLDRARPAARRLRSSTSAPTTAASSTPPPTPRCWSPGRGTPATTPRRPASRR